MSAAEPDGRMRERDPDGREPEPDGRVALVLVSHSDRLAEGTAELAGQMAPGVLILAAGGIDGRLGTDFELIGAAIARAGDGRPVVVLTDLGSAVLTTEAVLEDLEPGLAERVALADAPFVEGAVAAAVTAHGGGDLADVLAAAEHAGSLFAGSAGAGSTGTTETTEGTGTVTDGTGTATTTDAGTAPEIGGPPVRGGDGVLRARGVLLNPLGLHARPAAVVARMLAGYDAKVRINGVNAASVLELMKLGATQGVELTMEAEGPQAAEAMDALTAAVGSGFGEI